MLSSDVTAQERNRQKKVESIRMREIDSTEFSLDGAEYTSVK